MTRLKGPVKAHGWLHATLQRAKSLGQTFPKGLGPACADGKSVKGFAEIFILTSNVITTWKPNMLLSEWLIGER